MASSSLPRHDTYQSDDTFSVSVYVRNLEPSDVAVSFRERSIKLIVPGAEYDISPLAHPIDPESSTYKVSKIKVELSLKKKDVGLKWNKLQGEEDAVLMSAPHSKEETAPAVARQKKNWSQISEEALAAPEGEPEPDADVNSFFKKLYAGADPDAQRAMLKSFQESGGTTLSTDWKDIGSKTTKIAPPDGAEAKKW